MNKLLIIEDDPIVEHIYRSRLEKEGYEVDSCADGQSGFYRIHDFHPHVILLDLMLPKMNGIDILKKIRAQTQFQRVPIIVFTNAYVPNMIQEAFAAGASQVFNKATLTPRQILDAIQTLLTGGSAEGAASSHTTPPIRPPGSTGNTTFQRVSDIGSAPFHEPRLQAAPAPTNAAPLAPGQAFAPPPPTSSEEDAKFQAELAREFQENKPQILAELRKHLQEFSRTQDEAARLPHLLELYRRIHALTGAAGIAGVYAIAQMAAALEVLLKELYEKPKNISASTVRTVACAVDFIGELFRAPQPAAIDNRPANILVVDDEILSRRAVIYALEKAGLKSVAVEDPGVALTLTTETAYDLIFLDVQMPGMDGFELCTKIRGESKNKTTPVIFVTSLTDFKSRAKSSLSGGTDLIAKPFMFIELSVKALGHVLRGRLLADKQAA
jgi:DNA-binding response OmpR family regulator/HPt (histidine-containing phosphotransfer) domain-containing protein